MKSSLGCVPRAFIETISHPDIPLSITSVKRVGRLVETDFCLSGIVGLMSYNAVSRSQLRSWWGGKVYPIAYDRAQNRRKRWRCLAVDCVATKHQGPWHSKNENKHAETVPTQGPPRPRPRINVKTRSQTVYPARWCCLFGLMEEVVAFDRILRGETVQLASPQPSITDTNEDPPSAPGLLLRLRVRRGSSYHYLKW